MDLMRWLSQKRLWISMKARSSDRGTINSGTRNVRGGRSDSQCCRLNACDAKSAGQNSTGRKMQKESHILITPPKHPTNNINVVRTRHPMGSVALPDCSAEAVSKQSQGHAQQSQVTCASGWPPRDSNRAPTVGLLPTAGVERKIEDISSVEPLQLKLCLISPYIYSFGLPSALQCQSSTSSAAPRLTMQCTCQH